MSLKPCPHLATIVAENRNSATIVAVSPNAATIETATIVAKFGENDD